MNKSFEEAYKDLAVSEAPDLWARIEAGLSHKSTPQQTEAAKEAEETEKKQPEAVKKAGETEKKQPEAAKEAEETEKKPPEAVKKAGKAGGRVFVFLKRYSGMAAAVICAIIIIPAVLYMRGNGGSKDMVTQEAAYDTVEMAADTATEECAEEIEEPAAEAETAEAAPEAAGAGALMSESESAAATENESAGAMMESGAADKASKEMLEETADENQMKKEAAFQAAAAEDAAALVDGAIIEKVEVYVISAEEAEQEAEAGTLYNVRVEKDSSGSFAEGEELWIFAPAHSSVMLVKENTFVIDIKYDNTQEYPLSLVRLDEALENK